MAKILIRDLAENTTLDRQAMRVIAGGARNGGRQIPFDSLPERNKRIIDYPNTKPLKKSVLFK